jgi:two-component system OmpR family response regulator
MRLLVIDDNAALGWRLQNYLHKQFEVELAKTGEDGIRLASSGRFDEIILDLGLPDTNGHEVCQRLRQNGIAVPILILSGEGETDRKVQLLEDGADDYLTKPFEPPELLARINALIRRHQSKNLSSMLRLGDLIIDTRSRAVTRQGVTIALRRKEFDILEYLVNNRGTIVTQPMIIDHIWNDPDKDAWANTVRVHIKHLRDKIDRPFDTPLIKTAHGVGYLIEDAEPSVLL